MIREEDNIKKITADSQKRILLTEVNSEGEFQDSIISYSTIEMRSNIFTIKMLSILLILF